jgi:hypothetical protein
MNKRIAVAAVPMLLALVACEERTPPAPTKPTASAPTGATGNERPAPPPTPPAAGAASATGAAPTGAAVTAAGLSFPLPDGWKQVPPSVSMRLAEVQVPDATGDPAKACLVTFSTAGGDVQANIDRWATQVRDAAGQPAKPDVQKRTVGGMNVTIAELTGAYSGMGDPTPRPNWTMRGAIIEAPGELVFVKMTGPAEQMAAAGPGFDRMIDGAKGL